jgi:hypothetical protein
VAAVIVADNCQGSIHAQVSAIVSRPAGRTSLMTIDHELDDGGMDGSLVVRMGDNSREALAGLVAQRCPWLTGTETAHMADFAGGNARVALKIAEGSRDGVDIASLKDSQMLDRLFQTDRGRLGPDARRWVARDPGARANRLAGFVPYFIRVEDADELEWSAIALGLIDAAPDPVQVLETLERRFWSGSGSGSFASRFVRRRPLVAAMAGHPERRVRN